MFNIARASTTGIEKYVIPLKDFNYQNNKNDTIEMKLKYNKFLFSFLLWITLLTISIPKRL